LFWRESDVARRLDCTQKQKSCFQQCYGSEEGTAYMYYISGKETVRRSLMRGEAYDLKIIYGEHGRKEAVTRLS
jgi:hypothetical protein